MIYTYIYIYIYIYIYMARSAWIAVEEMSRYTCLRF